MADSENKKRTRDEELDNIQTLMQELKRRMGDLQEDVGSDKTDSSSEEEVLEIDKENHKEPVEVNEPEVLLGSHPSEKHIGDAELISEVTDRLQVWLREGISKDERAQILELVPRKCCDCNISAPKLNEEIKLNLKEEVVKRDRYFNYQDSVGAGLSLTAMALSMVLNDKEVGADRDLLLQYLSDSVKVQADLFHA